MDRCGGERLRLSTPADWAQIQRIRSSVDAILIGAGTLWRDNPSLHGVPMRVVVSASGQLPMSAKFFRSEGEAVVLSGKRFTASEIVAALAERGVRRLLVEGGSEILRLFIDQGAADEVRVACNPSIHVRQALAPKFAARPLYRRWPVRQQELEGMEVQTFVRDGAPDGPSLQRAIELAQQAPPCRTCYQVGAVIRTDSNEIFEGYTHETSPTHHAEQEALLKAVAAGADLRGATIYSSMEPCSERRSEPLSCTQLILEHGLRRVVYALDEPSHFVAQCQGARLLRQAGVEVLQSTGPS